MGYASLIKQQCGFGWILSVLMMGVIALVAAPANSATNPLLSTTQIGSSDISPFTKWTALMPRFQMQQFSAATECIGDGCLNRQWEELLVELRHVPVDEQIAAVNEFFNAITYVSDEKNYGIADYWQTPYELMERGGDCEDYAIAKYISLKRLGVPERAMRILVVKDTQLNDTIHAVLEVRAGEDVKILDNQNQAVMPIAQVVDYQPMFAINESQWWSYK